MKKSLLFVCLMLAGLLCATADAQMNKSEYARKAAEKLVKGDRAGAIAVLDKAIEQRKDLNELYAMRGHLRLGAGDLDGAIDDLTIVVNSRMGGAPSNLDKGLLLLLQGREAEAEKEFALHLQTYPGSKEYLTRTIEEAKRLRSNQPQQ